MPSWVLNDALKQLEDLIVRKQQLLGQNKKKDSSSDLLLSSDDVAAAIQQVQSWMQSFVTPNELPKVCNKLLAIAKQRGEKRSEYPSHLPSTQDKRDVNNKTDESVTFLVLDTLYMLLAAVAHVPGQERWQDALVGNDESKKNAEGGAALSWTMDSPLTDRALCSVPKEVAIHCFGYLHHAYSAAEQHAAARCLGVLTLRCESLAHIVQTHFSKPFTSLKKSNDLREFASVQNAVKQLAFGLGTSNRATVTLEYLAALVSFMKRVERGVLRSAICNSLTAIFSNQLRPDDPSGQQRWAAFTKRGGKPLDAFWKLYSLIYSTVAKWSTKSKHTMLCYPLLARMVCLAKEEHFYSDKKRFDIYKELVAGCKRNDTRKQCLGLVREYLRDLPDAFVNSDRGKFSVQVKALLKNTLFPKRNTPESEDYGLLIRLTATAALRAPAVVFEFCRAVLQPKSSYTQVQRALILRSLGSACKKAPALADKHHRDEMAKALEVYLTPQARVTYEKHPLVLRSALACFPHVRFTDPAKVRQTCFQACEFALHEDDQIRAEAARAIHTFALLDPATTVVPAVASFALVLSNATMDVRSVLRACHSLLFVVVGIRDHLTAPGNLAAIKASANLDPSAVTGLRRHLEAVVLVWLTHHAIAVRSAVLAPLREWNLPEFRALEEQQHAQKNDKKRPSSSLVPPPFLADELLAGTRATEPRDRALLPVLREVIGPAHEARFAGPIAYAWTKLVPVAGQLLELSPDQLAAMRADSDFAALYTARVEFLCHALRLNASNGSGSSSTVEDYAKGKGPLGCLDGFVVGDRDVLDFFQHVFSVFHAPEPDKGVGLPRLRGLTGCIVRSLAGLDPSAHDVLAQYLRHSLREKLGKRRKGGKPVDKFAVFYAHEFTVQAVAGMCRNLSAEQFQKVAAAKAEGRERGSRGSSSTNSKSSSSARTRSGTSTGASSQSSLAVSMQEMIDQWMGPDSVGKLSMCSIRCRESMATVVERYLAYSGSPAANANTSGTRSKEKVLSKRAQYLQFLLSPVLLLGRSVPYVKEVLTRAERFGVLQDTARDVKALEVSVIKAVGAALELGTLHPAKEGGESAVVVLSRLELLIERGVHVHEALGATLTTLLRQNPRLLSTFLAKAAYEDPEDYRDGSYQEPSARMTLGGLYLGAVVENWVQGIQLGNTPAPPEQMLLVSLLHQASVVQVKRVQALRLAGSLTQLTPPENRLLPDPSIRLRPHTSPFMYSRGIVQYSASLAANPRHFKYTHGLLAELTHFNRYLDAKGKKTLLQALLPWTAEFSRLIGSLPTEEEREIVIGSVISSLSLVTQQCYDHTLVSDYVSEMWISLLDTPVHAARIVPFVVSFLVARYAQQTRSGASGAAERHLLKMIFIQLARSESVDAVAENLLAEFRVYDGGACPLYPSAFAEWCAKKHEKAGSEAPEATEMAAFDLLLNLMPEHKTLFSAQAPLLLQTACVLFQGQASGRAMLHGLCQSLGVHVAAADTKEADVIAQLARERPDTRSAWAQQSLHWAMHSNDPRLSSASLSLLQLLEGGVQRVRLSPPPPVSISPSSPRTPRTPRTPRRSMFRSSSWRGGESGEEGEDGQEGKRAGGGDMWNPRHEVETMHCLLLTAWRAVKYKQWDLLLEAVRCLTMPAERPLRRQQWLALMQTGNALLFLARADLFVLGLQLTQAALDSRIQVDGAAAGGNDSGEGEGSGDAEDMWKLKREWYLEQWHQQLGEPGQHAKAAASTDVELTLVLFKGLVAESTRHETSRVLRGFAWFHSHSLPCGNSLMVMSLLLSALQLADIACDLQQRQDGGGDRQREARTILLERRADGVDIACSIATVLNETARALGGEDRQETRQQLVVCEQMSTLFGGLAHSLCVGEDMLGARGRLDGYYANWPEQAAKVKAEVGGEREGVASVADATGSLPDARVFLSRFFLLFQKMYNDEAQRPRALPPLPRAPGANREDGNLSNSSNSSSNAANKSKQADDLSLHDFVLTFFRHFFTAAEPELAETLILMLGNYTRATPHTISADHLAALSEVLLVTRGGASTDDAIAKLIESVAGVLVSKAEKQEQSRFLMQQHPPTFNFLRSHRRRGSQAHGKSNSNKTPIKPVKRRRDSAVTPPKPVELPCAVGQDHHANCMGRFEQSVFPLLEVSAKEAQQEQQRRHLQVELQKQQTLQKQRQLQKLSEEPAGGAASIASSVVGSPKTPDLTRRVSGVMDPDKVKKPSKARSPSDAGERWQQEQQRKQREREQQQKREKLARLQAERDRLLREREQQEQEQQQQMEQHEAQRRQRLEQLRQDKQRRYEEQRQERERRQEEQGKKDKAKKQPRKPSPPTKPKPAKMGDNDEPGNRDTMPAPAEQPEFISVVSGDDDEPGARAQWDSMKSQEDGELGRAARQRVTKEARDRAKLLAQQQQLNTLQGVGSMGGAGIGLEVPYFRQNTSPLELSGQDPETLGEEELRAMLKQLEQGRERETRAMELLYHSHRRTLKHLVSEARKQQLLSLRMQSSDTSTLSSDRSLRLAELEDFDVETYTARVTDQEDSSEDEDVYGSSSSSRAGQAGNGQREKSSSIPVTSSYMLALAAARDHPSTPPSQNDATNSYALALAAARDHPSTPPSQNELIADYESSGDEATTV